MQSPSPPGQRRMCRRCPVGSPVPPVAARRWGEGDLQVCWGDAVLIEGFPVQFLPAPTPLVHEALTEARTVEVGKQRTRVFSAEHAVAVALQTNRATDRLKIEHLLESGREPLDEARLAAILKAHGLEDRWKKFLETRR